MSRPQFHVVTWLSCCLLHSVSRPQFDVATSFLLPVTDSWSQLPFSCCDSKLFVFSLSCRGMGFRSRPNRFFSLLKFMSRPQKHVATSFLPILSQPHFLVLVTTVSSQFSLFYWSRPRKCVATEYWPFLLCFCHRVSNLVATCFNCSTQLYVAT